MSDKTKLPPHPIQPVVTDAKGVLRFRGNRIVRHLLDTGGIYLNDIAAMDFSRDDRQQFAQLIGYSLSGYGDLSYVTDEAYGAAQKMARYGLSEDQARSEALREQLHDARVGMRLGVAALFGIHPDDLEKP